MLILALDSATALGATALYDQQGLVAESNLKLDLTHSERLMPQIIELLARARVEVGDLSGIVSGVGPGSFTGIRIALATAKTLAQSLDLELVGVSTLELLANGVLGTENYICPLLDAKRERVYTALYRGEYGSGLKRSHLPEQMIAIQELLSKIKEELKAEVTFIGPAVQEYRALIKEELGAQALFLDELYNWPRGAILAKIGAIKLKSGQGLDFLALEANYLKLSQAERDW